MRKLCYFIWFLAVSLGLVGCKPGTDDTIILFGEETGFKTMQDLMSDLSEDQQNTFLAKLNEISGNQLTNSEGVIPPDIHGEYKISLKQFVNSNIGFDFFDDNRDVLLRVFNQQNRMAKVDFYEGGVSRIDDAFVIGNGNGFTLYFTEERDMVFMGQQYEYERLIAITGEKANDGIRNLYFGSVILKVENGLDPLVGDFEPGWYFIYKDADGLSESGDWF